MRKPRELKESVYLQYQLPKITIEEVLDMHNLFSVIGPKKFWEFFNSCTSIRNDIVDPNKFKEEDPIPDKFDPNKVYFAGTISSIDGWVVPKSSDMNWKCDHCCKKFLASWSPIDCEAHGVDNPYCPYCGRWEDIRFLK